MVTVTVANIIPPTAFVLSTRYVQVASMTLIVYDHILTFQDEIDLVWRGVHSRSWPRFIFLVARYGPSLVLITNSLGIMGLHHSQNLYGYVLLGRGWLLFHGWSGLFFFAAVQVISQMRLWAIYRSKSLFYTMTVLILLALVSMGMVEGFGYRKFEATNTPAFPYLHVHICGPTNTLHHYVYSFWIPPLLVETVSVILVAYKAIQYFRTGAPDAWVGSRIMNSVLRYSVFYFVVVLSVYVANIYVWATQRVFAFELFIPLTFALPSVAGNRMLLSLRGVFYEDNAVLPGKDSIGLKVVNPDRGLTIETHNPLKEFESFFGENT